MIEVVMERNGATLIRRENGRLGCRCPFACLATNEHCEFDEETDGDLTFVEDTPDD